MKRRFAQYKDKKYAAMIPDVIENKLMAKTEDNTTVITLYGVIGSWHDDISANMVVAMLDEVDTPNITIRLNSPGGEADQGISIYNRIKDHPAKVKIIVDGMAASAGGIICMAADELVMNTGSLFMMHEALTFFFGNKNDVSKEMVVLEKLDEAQADIFMTKANVSREEIMTLLENETWFTASELVDFGLATATEDVEPSAPVSAEAYKKSILTRFQKVEPDKKTPPAASVSTSTNMLDRFKRPE